MKAARLVVLGVAIAAGGVAALLAGRGYKTPEVKQEPAAQIETVDVLVARSDLPSGLTPAQRADVLAFAQLWRREATSDIVVDVPQGGPTDHAAADSMREINSIFAASGVPRNAVFVRPYQPSGAALIGIRINYSKLVAEAGPCGQWPHDLGPSLDTAYQENRPFWNLGCAHQRNLAAMVDNLADLVQPRGETAGYTGRRTVVLDKYRKDENPSGAYPSDGQHGYDAGKLSDLGK